MPNYEHLVEVFQVLEYKDDEVFKTKSCGERWVPADIPAPKGFIYSSLSTERTLELLDQGQLTVRRMKDA